MELEMTEQADQDLIDLPDEVGDTFFNKKEDLEGNLELVDDPGQAFHKRMSGRMHPVLQMKLGGDYQAWALEGRHLHGGEEESIYFIRVLTKKEAKKLTKAIQNARVYFDGVL